MTDLAYRDHYDKLAASDLQTPILDQDYAAGQLRNLMRRLGRVNGLEVCDLGCGAGTLTAALLGAGAEVTAVDISQVYLDRLSGLRVGLVQADADDLPFYREFDLIVATDVMEHTLRPGGFLYSLNRSLKPRGVAVIRVPYRENLLAYAPQWCEHEFVHLRSYNKGLLRDTLRGAGFRVERFWLDGFSLSTPQPWFINTSLGNRYNLWAERAKRRYRADVVTQWPAWLARLLMRPQEITVRATKIAEIQMGGSMFEMV